MAKKLALILFSFSLLAYGTNTKTLTIDEAIAESMKYVSSRLANGTRVVILNIESESDRLSSYVIDEGNMFIMNNTKLSLVQSKDNAQSIVSGNISRLGDNYRFRIEVLSVAGGNIQGVQSFNVRENDVLLDLLQRRNTSRVTNSATATVTAKADHPTSAQTAAVTHPSISVGRQYVVPTHTIVYRNMIANGNDTTFVIDATERRTPAPTARTSSYSAVVHSEVPAAETTRGTRRNRW